MSVVGIDLGAQSTKIGVARNKGIDIITNETSNRQTPSLVGFGPKSRYLGEAAKTQEISNLKNTVSSLKRLAGRTINDPEVAIEQEYITAPLVDVNGQVGAEVTYRGEKQKFTATQLIAMYLGKIRDTAAKETKLAVSDVVISCPAWFADSQRRAMLDAAEIASLKTLRLINDNTAIALGYGITKTDLPEADQKPRRVMFVDIGYSDYTASVVEFKKGELSVKGTAWDRHFGGRDFDKALVDHFAAEFKEKFKVDIHTNLKAKTRVAAAVEKLKKILSANAQAPISIESLMDDKDVRGSMKREELEVLIQPLLDRVTAPLEQALKDAKLKPEDIDSIEMVGGCTRVPSIKDRVSKFFGKPLSYTLNQDEAIARGCAFACAILSPVFRVRDFSIHDIVSYPIEFAWEQSPDIPDEDTNLEVFKTGNVMPSTKILTFYRKDPFDLEAKYSKPDMLPGKLNPWIGRFSVKGVKANPNDKEHFMICKLKARLNLHGVLNVESGYYVEDVEIEEPVPEGKEGEKKDGDAMETDQPNGSADAPKTRKVKKQVRKGDLPVAAGTSSLDSATKATATEQENAMFMEDKLVTDTEDKKNELEAYIYELRGQVDDLYADFSSDDEKAKIKEKLEKAEDWLYEDGEDASKAQYIAKMDEIRFVAGPVIQRYNDKLEEERQARQKVEEEAAAKRKAEADARKKEEEAKKAAEKAEEKPAAEPQDTEMSDANGETVKPDGVEEAK
ncbi:Heat shock protein hsp88 [Cyphellophora attinorum]|uniref:Heat shock protein hsp88 n=1 Tax=Cyphellophora attinorum TaxID=1664694 RepID=A0A0N1P357_9EURO|nr:Heat shock protein hsp88 [Phialophora attinorum]KPI43502.1 Heat shock protein hsp88 [Phialophora attinorum]